MGDCDVLGVKAFLRYELAWSGISIDDLEPKDAGHRPWKSHIETMMFLNKISVEELKEGSYYMLPENSQGMAGEDIDDGDDDDYNNKKMKKKIKKNEDDDDYNWWKMKKKMKMKKKKKKNEDDDDYNWWKMKKKMKMKKKTMKKKMKKKKNDYDNKKNDTEMTDGPSREEIWMMMENVMPYRIKESKKLCKELGIPWSA